jgi:hypothetical protein
MIRHSELPPTLQQVLEPGENVLWADRPVAWRLAIRKWPLCLIGSLMLYFGVSVLRFLLRTDPGHGPVNHAILWPMLVFLALGFCIPCVIGLIAASSPFFRAFAAKRTIYDITDRRVLIVVAPRLGGASTYSFRSGEITRVTCLTSAGGTIGDIVLWRGPINFGTLGTSQAVAMGDYRIECGLWAVPQPHIPEQLIRRLHLRPEPLV